MQVQWQNAQRTMFVVIFATAVDGDLMLGSNKSEAAKGGSVLAN